MSKGTLSVWLAWTRGRGALAALALAAGALLSAWLVHLELVRSLRIESASQRALVAATDQAVQAKAPPCDPRFTYAQSLPASVSLDKLVLKLQENSKVFGVDLRNVSGELHRAGDRALDSLVVTIELQGGYAGLRSTLSESLSRFPTGVVQAIHLKRAAGAVPPVESAGVQVAFPLRPAGFPLPNCRPPSAHSGTDSHP